MLCGWVISTGLQVSESMSKGADPDAPTAAPIQEKLVVYSDPVMVHLREENKRVRGATAQRKKENAELFAASQGSRSTDRLGSKRFR